MANRLLARRKHFAMEEGGKVLSLSVLAASVAARVEADARGFLARIGRAAAAAAVV